MVLNVITNANEISWIIQKFTFTFKRDWMRKKSGYCINDMQYHLILNKQEVYSYLSSKYKLILMWYKRSETNWTCSKALKIVAMFWNNF